MSENCSSLLDSAALANLSKIKTILFGLLWTPPVNKFSPTKLLFFTVAGGVVTQFSKKMLDKKKANKQREGENRVNAECRRRQERRGRSCKVMETEPNSGAH